jgi:predicted LPLAT superfamily acyltransferase
MSARGSHWASINEASFVGGMQFLFWVCRVFGRWPFRLVLYPVLCWYVATRPAARRASGDYLARVAQRTPVKHVKTGLAGVFLHFASFAETILDKMLLWGGLFDTSKVSMHGAAPLLELIANGRGALLLCSHLGNLDLCRVMASQVPQLRLTVLVHTRHARAFNAMLAKLDPRSGLNLLQVTQLDAGTATMLAARVAQGEFVVIAGDRVPVPMGGVAPRLAHADFLGRRAAFPIGPYVMASVLDCPLYCLFAARDGGGHALHFELLEQQVRLPRKERAAALDALAARFAARLEHHCLRAPSCSTAAA